MPGLRPLYEISHEMAVLIEALDNLEEGQDLAEVSVGGKSLSQWMESLGEEEAQKLESYVMYINKLEQEAEAAKKVVELYQKKAKTRLNRADHLRKVLKEHTQKFGPRITSTGIQVSIRLNGGDPPIETDDEMLSTFDRGSVEYALYVNETRSWNKIAIKKALKEGQVLSFARFGLKGTSLQIA